MISNRSSSTTRVKNYTILDKRKVINKKKRNKYKKSSQNDLTNIQERKQKSKIQTFFSESTNNYDGIYILLILDKSFYNLIDQISSLTQQEFKTYFKMLFSHLKELEKDVSKEKLDNKKSLMKIEALSEKLKQSKSLIKTLHNVISDLENRVQITRNEEIEKNLKIQSLEIILKNNKIEIEQLQRLYSNKIHQNTSLKKEISLIVN